MDWINAAKKVIEYSGYPQTKKLKYSLDILVSFEALTGWLESPLTEYTEGSYEGVSRRVVWAFPDDWMLTLGSNILPTLTRLNHELRDNDKPSNIAFKNWVFKHEANGWHSVNHLEASDILSVIQELSNAHGVPKVYLPWEHYLQNAVDEGEDFYSYWENDEEKTKLYKTFYDFSIMFNSGKISNVFPWEVEIVQDEDFISEYSNYNKFQRLVSALEDTGKWLVIIDEHCAACASGTRKFFVESHPELSEAPEFLTWGQNSQDSWLPDGSFWAEVWIDKWEDEKFVKTLANTFGFDFVVPQSQDEAEGAITFSF